VTNFQKSLIFSILELMLFEIQSSFVVLMIPKVSLTSADFTEYMFNAQYNNKSAFLHVLIAKIQDNST